MLFYSDQNDCVFVDKPEGWSTHSPGLGQRGLVELYSSRLNLPLLVNHRLDKGTSGALVFAKTKAAAETLRQAFEAHQVKKTYWFVTSGKSEFSQHSIESQIEKEGSQFVSRKSQTPNSKTHFQRIKRSPFFELWQAQPETGKTHQIRLHARDLGIPILGDTIYGGATFPRICLHALELEIPGFPKWICPAPRLFERLGLLRDPKLAEILCEIDRRQRLFNFLGHPTTTLRLVHLPEQNLAIDLLGENLWIHWYQDQDPTTLDLERFELISTILGKPAFIQKRLNRGATNQIAEKWMIHSPQPKWSAVEHHRNFITTYSMNSDQGESYGLFLDQRVNRSRLAQIAHSKRILNLFAYTGGFGIVAAQGGAATTTTVDLSSNTIEWAKTNFKLNGFTGSEHEFFAADCFFFLDRAQKKNRKWDIIVCDPPIFSRSKEGTFRVEQDLKKLLDLCQGCLSPGGWILFSTHYAGWNQQQLKTELKKIFKGLVLDGEVDVDYPIDHALKSFWLQKLSD